MYIVARICSALLVANVIVMARPSVDSANQGSAEDVKQYKQSILETADPQRKEGTLSTFNENNNAKRQLNLEETNIPVKLIYGDNHRNGRNVKTENVDNKSQETEVPRNEIVDKTESPDRSENVGNQNSKGSTAGANELEEKEKESDTGPQARLLSIEERENDENAQYGLQIQSRNKADTIYSDNNQDTAFSYGLRALPFNTFILSKNNKNDNSFTGSITRISPGNFGGDDGLSDEEAVVVGNEDEEREGNVKRRIQHYQYVIQPSRLLFGSQQYPVGGGYSFLQQPTPTFGWAPPSYYRQNMFAPQLQTQIPVPFSLYPANRVPSQGNFQRASKPASKLFDDYFPIIVNNPFNEIWLGLTNIVEYGPGADVCRSSADKKARRVDDDKETEVDLSTPRGSEQGPQITRLKVRRGGVAIAGPGGIATAGSGGTAIVGPGGTAYTTPSGTAVVGPGGKVVHVPEFPLFRGDGSEPRIIEIPSNGKLVASGPVVYYDPPSSLN